MRYKIGSRIKKYRELKGLSQLELAALLGVSNSRISNREQGLNRPDADILASLCRALRVSPEEYSEKERRVIAVYREKTDMQKAVDILLGLEKNG